jgi:uncharacterized protein YdhG (YjbR/CyaY superfamily)
VSVDEYLEAQPEGPRARLRELRAAIRAAVPEADELVSYGMPTYKLNGRAVAHFAAAKRHCALYGAVPAELDAEVSGYRRLKGTVQFPLDKPIPEDLVRRIVMARAAERGV